MSVFLTVYILNINKFASMVYINAQSHRTHYCGVGLNY